MIIALNNKSNLTKEEFLKYKEDIQKLNFKTSNVILIPSNIYLAAANIPNISLGSQNVSMYEMGPHTGEVSASQLKQLGVSYCLVGHSERRKEQHETNIEIRNKIKNLLNQGIIPILCIGETKEEKNTAHTVIYQELQEALIGLTEEELKKVIIAYEPVWSIGTGLIPTSTEIESIVTKIKETYPNNLVLYGGSVTLENIEKLTQENAVDGYLLGGLSLQLDKVQILIDKIEK
ncbi:MAG: triose-phosphate isomerase [Tenericutes bacterium]|nr:triose-phosphate isomerase [Mycoplasmatota bacterium]